MSNTPSGSLRKTDSPDGADAEGPEVGPPRVFSRASRRAEMESRLAEALGVAEVSGRVDVEAMAF